MEETYQNKNLTKIDRLKKIFKENIFFILMMLTCIIFMCNFRIIRVSGNSMDTTLANKEFHFARLTNNIKKNDIIVANSDILNCIIIKRVIAIPGDTIKIKDNQIYVNDEKIKETYIKENMITPDMESYTLKDGEYFCCGDNRNNSTDSRDIGPINIKDMIGIMIF